MFSLYERILVAAREQGLPLQDLGETSLAGDEGRRTPAQFKARVWSLSRWCRICEKLVLERDLRDARVVAGFQKLSRFVPSARRYAELGRVAASVTVLAERDVGVPMPAGVSHVTLSASETLANEWFLLIESRTFQALLSAVALDRFGDAPLTQRKFLGLTTHNEGLVRSASELLGSRLGS